nr:hypothetical protein GCM10020093_019810 [Planobispora longispora]
MPRSTPPGGRWRSCSPRPGRRLPAVHHRHGQDLRPRSGRPPRTRPGAVAADKAYFSRANRAYLRKRRIKAVIPEKKDQAANRRKKGSRGGRPVGYASDLYKERNTVEWCFQKIKTWRCLATRYDKASESYEAGLYLRGSVMWLKLLTSTT